MTTLATGTVPLEPRVDMPEDPGLQDLPMLFDGDWVWEAYCGRFGSPEVPVQEIRVQRFSHSPGRQATVTYAAEWNPEEFIPSEHFTIRLNRGGSIELFRFPDDGYLPGLARAAIPEEAIKLLNKHVTVIPARRVRVDVVRYRPGSHAVLRHRIKSARFYVRAIRPASVASYFEAAELVGHSGFIVPRLAGCWADGGVLWLSEIPGSNLRENIRGGHQPDPGMLLDGLERLWSAPGRNDHRPFDLSGAYRWADRTLKHAAREREDLGQKLEEATRVLDPFVESWTPSCIAHNDFYDDQMLVLPDGRVALVDFEETGAGDPMLDVGNFLAHLRWAGCFRREGPAEASQTYHQVFRRAALDRFLWSEQDLAAREAVCLFRICTNTIRHLQQDWPQRLEEGLSLVIETLS